MMPFKLSDVRFWILVAFLLRLPTVFQAPLEPSHAWRQSLTNMVSRTYYENDLKGFLYPRSGILDKQNDMIAQEFPTYNFLHAALAKLFGWQHWYGRLLNLIISSLALYAFYLFLMRFVKDDIALTAVIILTCSIWFSFSRKLMPDVWSVSLVLIGIWSITEYVIRQPAPLWRLFLGLMCIASGGLSKIPALLPLSFLWLPLVEYRHLSKKWLIVISSVISLLWPIYWWYFIHVPEIVNKGGYQLFFPYRFTEGWHTFISLWRSAMEKLYFSAFQSFTAFLFLMVGLFVLLKKRDSQYLFLFFSSLILLLFFAIKTGEVFPTHNYYIIPFVPVMALISALGLNLLPVQNYRIGALVVICAEALLNQASDFYIREDRKSFLAFESKIENIVPLDDTLAVYTEGNPLLPYFLNRKCVRVSAGQYANMDDIRFRDHLHYFVALKSELPQPWHPIIYEDEDLYVCSLNQLPDSAAAGD